MRRALNATFVRQHQLSWHITAAHRGRDGAAMPSRRSSTSVGDTVDSFVPARVDVLRPTV